MPASAQKRQPTAMPVSPPQPPSASVAWASIGEARRLFYADDLDAAIACAQQALEAADNASPALGTGGEAAGLQRHAIEASALWWLTRCTRRQDRLDLALAHAHAGAAAAQAAGDVQLECRLRSQHVHLLASLGQNEAALPEAFEVLAHAVQSEDALAQASALLALGHVHWTMQQWEAGREAYQQSLAWADKSGDAELRGLASNGIAAMQDHFANEARAAGRLAQAASLARLAGELVLDYVEFSREVGDVYNIWSGQHNYACCLFAMGENDAARAVLREQLAALPPGAGFRRCLVLQQLGAIDLREERSDLAMPRLQEALQIAEQLQMPMFAMNACLSLVEASERQGDLAAALRYHRQYHAFYVRLASERAQAHARALAVMYETDKARAVAQAQRLRAEKLETSNTRLSVQAEQSARASLEDALTGLANRRRFDDVMRHDLAQRHDAQPYSLALLDVDFFKLINDRFSHMVGDAVLRRLGALLGGNCRAGDLAARFGGEEFVLVLSGLSRDAAVRACERVRVAIEAEDWSELHADLTVTVSIGLAHRGESSTSQSPETLLALADKRLYAAKRAGRNRVVDCDDLVPRA